MIQGKYRLKRAVWVRRDGDGVRIITTQRIEEPTLALAISKMNEWTADPETLSANIETFA